MPRCRSSKQNHTRRSSLAPLVWNRVNGLETSKRINPYRCNLNKKILHLPKPSWLSKQELTNDPSNYINNRLRNDRNNCDFKYKRNQFSKDQQGDRRASLPRASIQLRSAIQNATLVSKRWRNSWEIWVAAQPSNWVVCHQNWFGVCCRQWRHIRRQTQGDGLGGCSRQLKDCYTWV